MKKLRWPAAFVISALIHLGIISLISPLCDDVKTNNQRSKNTSNDNQNSTVVLDSLENYVQLRDSSVAGYDDWVYPWGYASYKVPAEYYYRDCPYEAILDQGIDFFYFVKGFPDLLNSAKTETELAKNDPEPSTLEKNIDKPLQIYIVDADQLINKPASESILSMTEEEMLRKFEGMMVMNEYDQTLYFLENYINKYDSEKGDLQKFTRWFMEWNLTGYNLGGSELSQSFSLAENNYISKSVNNLFHPFIKENPDSRVSLEFLFDLGYCINTEKRTLRYLDMAHIDALETLEDKPDPFGEKIFHKKAKALVIKELYDQFWAEMQKRGFQSVEDIYKIYEEEQDKILNHLIAKGGEIVNRTLFWNGYMCWAEDKKELAYEKWKQIGPKPVFHQSWMANAYQAIKEEIESDWIYDGTIKRILREIQPPYFEQCLERKVRHNIWAKR